MPTSKNSSSCRWLLAISLATPALVPLAAAAIAEELPRTGGADDDMLLAVLASARTGARASEAILTPGVQVLPCLYFLLERSRFSAGDREAAAWLVQVEGGGASCLPWPEANVPGIASWTGPRPPRLLAQFHTHQTRAPMGRSWGVLPAQDDCRAAQRLGVPVVIVTPTAVNMCTPDRGEIVRLLGPDWVAKARASR